MQLDVRGHRVHETPMLCSRFEGRLHFVLSHLVPREAGGEPRWGPEGCRRAVYPRSTPTLSLPVQATHLWFPGGSNGRTRNLIPCRRRRDTSARGGSMNVKPLAD